MMELSIWTVLSFWIAVLVGACLAMLLLLIYEGWSARQGFRAWSVLAISDGEVTSPSWRRLWWWLLLSFAVLIGGVFVG